MSSDEESHSGSESEEEVVTKPTLKREQSETEAAMKKRRDVQKQNTSGLDEAALSLLENNKLDRDKMEDEINELRLRAERRKKEREIEEKRLAAERAAEDERRKAAEETKKKQKSEEEEKRQKERAKKLAELEKMRNPPKPNFVITKKSGSGSEDEDEEDEEKDDTTKNRKSKQQLEAEKIAILSQRVKELEIAGFNSSKLAEKAKELHNFIYKLEGEKYDLEKHFKAQQFDMMELAERARQINKVGKGGLKRIQCGPDDPVDKIQEKFAGTPARIEMYSKYERQKDKRDYVERLTMFKGPQFSCPAERIKPTKIVAWDEEGMPIYASPSNGHAEDDE